MLVLAAVLFISACHRAPQAPTGQVAATVGTHEITIRELQSEVSTLPPAPPAAQKQQQQAALNLIIQRTILADAARKQGIDKDPNFLLLSQRTNDALLVRQLEAKIAAAVPASSQEEISQFQNANPDMFAQRKIFDVEQIRMAEPADQSVIKKLEPLKTLDQIADFLTQNKISFQRGTSSIDALGQNPKLVSAIVALPPQEVFIINAGNQVLINLVHATRVQPFTGDTANKFAGNYLRAQHTQDAVRRQMGILLAAAQRDVRFAKQYQPVPVKPAAAPKTEAPKGG